MADEDLNLLQTIAHLPVVSKAKKDIVHLQRTLALLDTMLTDCNGHTKISKELVRISKNILLGK
jgi:hypothetical protein